MLEAHHDLHDFKSQYALKKVLQIGHFDLIHNS